MIQAVLPRDGGSLSVLGRDPSREGAAVRQRLGVVPQGDNLDPDLSCRDNLWVYGRFFGQSRRKARREAERLLELAQLVERAEAKPRELSGGMRRRLMIARAMINEPELLLLDEPTTALDPHARHSVWGWLQQLKTDGLTMLLTTHDMDEAERLCGRLCVMDAGKRLSRASPTSSPARGRADSRVPRGPGALAELVALPRRGDRRLLAQFPSEEDARASVRRVVDAGVEVSVRRATLEDVFLKLTGRVLRL